MNYIHKGVRLPEDLIQKIEEVGAQTGLSFSETIRNILAKHINLDSVTKEKSTANNLPEYEKRRINLELARKKLQEKRLNEKELKERGLVEQKNQNQDIVMEEEDKKIIDELNKPQKKIKIQLKKKKTKLLLSQKN